MIAERLARTPVRWSLLLPYAAHSKRGYTRVLLMQNASWNLLLIGWLPGQSTTIHGHGRSAGVARVLSGELLETKFVMGQGSLRALEPKLARPDAVLMEGHEVIHRVGNHADGPALSLHLYAPPLDGMVDFSGFPIDLPGGEQAPSIV